MNNGNQKLRKAMLVGLLSIYDGYQEWRSSSINELTGTYGITRYYISILIQKGIIEINGSKRKGYKYKWVGMRPSMHMINAVCDEQIKQKKARLPIIEEPQPSTKEEGLLLSNQDLLLLHGILQESIVSKKDAMLSLLKRTTDPNDYELNLKVLSHLNQMDKKISTKLEEITS